tara:strand:- start:232 stop:447 length:216 start_codon:yes stop_codon:yes gene_type:complete
MAIIKATFEIVEGTQIEQIMCGYFESVKKITSFNGIVVYDVQGEGIPKDYTEICLVFERQEDGSHKIIEWH